MNKRHLKVATLVSALAMTMPSMASENDSFSERQYFDKVTTDAFVEANKNKQFHDVIVGIEDRQLATALLTNDRMRKALEVGESFMYKGKEYVKTEHLLNVAEQFRQDIKSMLGYDVHVVQTFNDIYQILVTTDGSEEKEDVLKNLVRTGKFTYVQENKQMQLMGYDNEGDNKSMSVINPSITNDRHYAEQVYFARQVDGYEGAASIEVAKQILSDRGVFASGNKVNVHVLDGGMVPHEDLEYAEAVDFKYRNHHGKATEDGVIWVKKDFIRDDGQYVSPAFECSGFRSNPESAGATSWRPDPPPEDEADEWYRYDTNKGLSLNSLHGMQAAGVIAATSNNGIGISGIIPQENVNLVSALVVDACGGGSADIIKAIYWSIDNLESPYAIGNSSYDGLPYERTQYPADVINMSFGGGNAMCFKRDNGYWATAYGQVVQDADKKGTVLVSSAGNERTTGFNTSPAGCENIMSVGAIYDNGRPSAFTNFGDSVDVMAMGVNVWTLSGEVVDAGEFNLGYGPVNGTSFSGPIVAGLAGLLKLADNNLTPNQIVDLIKNGAKPLDVGFSGGETACGWLGCGAGAVNFENSVRILLDGEILGEPKATHYLADHKQKDNSNYISLQSEFNPNLCSTYKVYGSVMNDKYEDLEYTLYGQVGSGDYEVVKVTNNSNFTFNKEHDNYQLSACNATTGNCSRNVNVELDNGYLPQSCQ